MTGNPHLSSQRQRSIARQGLNMADSPLKVFALLGDDPRVSQYRSRMASLLY